MIYVDTDFFMALLKKNDWLKRRAEELWKQHRRELKTSVATVAELLLIGNRFSLDPENIVGSVFALVPNVTGIDCETALAAADLMKENGLTSFDALNAAYCRDDTMLSSDHVFDRIGVKRLPLEK